MDLLTSRAAEMGLEVTRAQVESFQCYAEELVEWNERFNLTAITDFAQIQTRHFLDSLTLLPVLAGLAGCSVAALTQRAEVAVDIGPGAGFPSLPLKILWPKLRLCLIEATAKKIEFMKHVGQRLGLSEIEFVHARAEEAGQNERYRERFNLVLSRAVAPMPTLAEYLLPFAKMKGRVVAYKAAAAEAEVQQAEKAIRILGGKLSKIHAVRIPAVDEPRALVMIDKIKKTPSAYPRHPGLAKKKPL